MSEDVANSNGNSGKKSWDEHFAALVVFRDEHGHCNVPYNWLQDPSLSWWVSDQRKRQARLPEDQKAKLDEIGFSFENPKKLREQQQWEEHFNELKTYKEEKGNTLVPYNWKGSPQLARWVARQRDSYNQKLLAEDRKAKLQSINFTFKAPTKRNVPQKNKKNDEQWKAQYNKLVAFREKYGHTRVPQGYGDKSLGQFVKKQREVYGKGLLRGERLTLLTNIEFEWSLPDAQFQEHYEELKAFKEMNGHLRIPIANSEANKKLNEWMYRQRVANNLGKLDPERKRLLDELNFPFETEPRNAAGAQMMRRGTFEGDSAVDNEYPIDAGAQHMQSQVQNPVPVTQQNHVPKMPQVDVNFVRKRFHDGWVNGKRIKKLRKLHHVKFSDGQEEYLSDEEFEVASFAYQNFSNRYR